MGETEEEALVSKPKEELGLDSPSPSSHATDPPPSVETLDEKLKNLGLERKQNEKNDLDEERNVRPHHPLRPGEPDCSHYLRTGICRYGLNCRYNHPQRSKKQVRSSSDSPEPDDVSSSYNTQFDGHSILSNLNLVVKEKEREKEGYQERRWQNLVLEKKQNENSEDKTVDEEEKNRRFQHPLRPGEADCTHYIRTGTCRYGLNCRYNHPTRSKKPAHSSSDSPNPDEEEEGYEEGEGQVECKYYLRPGGCKYGAACRFQHLQEKTFVAPTLDLNFLGLPVRPGEMECPFYMRTGSCKFATNCRYHHPNPTDLGGLDPLSGYHNTGSVPLHSSGLSQPAIPSWPLQRNSNEMVPYLEASPSYAPLLSPPQGVHPNLEWNGYLPPLNPLYPPSANMGPPMGSVLGGSTKKADGFTHHQQQMPVDEYPERPGEKECEYFMKNGDCKFKSNCKFHHPKNRAPKCVLSPMGLPLRPDEVTCSYYSRYGICKFGPACKYDHPPNAGSSASGGARRMGGRGNVSEALIQQSV
ncbi:zinc finger protein [Macleaya cordata]|uniref:Zinc finger protein n=1 Tax=Macleaya cordata TaxID=56857 RepID=A0A200R4F2_MACCD|nr:zinc finger protein [Macleaya cordata]